MVLFDDPRSAWTTEVSTNPISVVPSVRTEFMVHWNGPKLGLTRASDHAKCLTTVRAIRVYHVDTRGWSDIGYNGLLCPHGRSIEGRGADLQGAHCADHNVLGYGWMALIGEGDALLDDDALLRLRQVYDECSSRSGRSLAKMGHRDGATTDCPGDALYAWVKAGMPVQETGGEMDQAQLKEILAAVATGKQEILTELDQIDQDISSARAESVAERKMILDRINELGEEIKAALLAELPGVIQQSVNDSLGGVEVTARYVRRTD